MNESITVSNDGRNATLTVQDTGEIIVANTQDATVVSVGIQGPAGAPGTSGDKHYEQTFTTASSVMVTHNLGKLPTIAVIDTSNDLVTGEVQYIDANTLRVLFSAPFSGVIICN